MYYLFIAIIVIIIILISYFIIKNNKKKERSKVYTETIESYQKTQKLELNVLDSLQRAKKISKNDESIKLYNLWLSEFQEVQVSIEELNIIDLELQELMNKNKHKDFMKLEIQFSSKVAHSSEKLEGLHEKLYNFTNYEMENTQIAIELKEQLKELQKNFANNLQSYEIYDMSFAKQIEEITYELNKFEYLQKNGEYTDAREHLKSGTASINFIHLNYDVLNNSYVYLKEMNVNLEIIQQVRNGIKDLNFQLDIDNLQNDIDQIINEKQIFSEKIKIYTFNEEISKEQIDSNEKELLEIENKIFTIKNKIEEQYKVIKEIALKIDENKQLLDLCDTLIFGATEEKSEIEDLYQIPELKAIKKFDEEVSRFKKFQDDYKLLLSVIYELKEDYLTLHNRIDQSNSYLKIFIDKIEKAIIDLKLIREDELNARLEIKVHKEKIMTLELYLRHYDHYYRRSDNLVSEMKEMLEKLDQLDLELNNSPLNISEVRNINNAINNLIQSIIKDSEKEIKYRIGGEKLITYCNQFIDEHDTYSLISHINSLFLNSEYTRVIQEIKSFLNSELSNGEEVYKNIVSKVQIESYKSFSEKI